MDNTFDTQTVPAQTGHDALGRFVAAGVAAALACRLPLARHCGSLQVPPKEVRHA